jgi:hypothetical protein
VEGLSTLGENDDPFQGWLNEEGTLTEPVQGPPPTDDLDWS